MIRSRDHEPISQQARIHMTKFVSKSELFARLGYGGLHDQLEEAPAEVGLSRPEKQNISPEKEGA